MDQNEFITKTHRDTLAMLQGKMRTSGDHEPYALIFSRRDNALRFSEAGLGLIPEGNLVEPTEDDENQITAMLISIDMTPARVMNVIRALTPEVAADLCKSMDSLLKRLGDVDLVRNTVLRWFMDNTGTDEFDMMLTTVRLLCQSTKAFGVALFLSGSTANTPTPTKDTKMTEALISILETHEEAVVQSMEVFRNERGDVVEFGEPLTGGSQVVGKFQNLLSSRSVESCAVH